MAARPVRTTLPVGDTTVHLFQVVREHRDDGSHGDWVVVGFTGDGVDLASVGFDWSRTVPTASLADGSFDPLWAADAPVWGY